MWGAGGGGGGAMGRVNELKVPVGFRNCCYTGNRRTGLRN